MSGRVVGWCAERGVSQGVVAVSDEGVVGWIRGDVPQFGASDRLAIVFSWRIRSV